MYVLMLTSQIIPSHKTTMPSSNASRRSSTATLTAIGGGIVVTATAIAALGLLGGFDNLKKDKQDAGSASNEFLAELLLPLPPTKSPVHAPSTTPSQSVAPSFRPSFTARPSAQPSSLPTHTALPSSMPSNHPSITTKPTAAPSLPPSDIPSANPSTQPSFKPSTSLVPTHHPTVSPTFSPSQRPTNEPTTLLHSLSTTGTFRLRMHWQPGFMVRISICICSWRLSSSMLPSPKRLVHLKPL